MGTQYLPSVRSSQKRFRNGTEKPLQLFSGFPPELGPAGNRTGAVLDFSILPNYNDSIGGFVVSATFAQKDGAEQLIWYTDE